MPAKTEKTAVRFQIAPFQIDVTPPVGTCLYVACSISKEPLDRVIRPLMPLLLVMAAMLAVVAFVPEITLVVPRWLYGK